MLQRQVSSPSLKLAVGTVTKGSVPNSPGLPHRLSSFNLHQGSAQASPHHSPRFLDFHPIVPHSPTVAKSRLVHHGQSGFTGDGVLADPTPPEALQSPKPTNHFAHPVRFELPPVVIDGLPVQQGLPGFASFNFGNIHSVTYRSTHERLPTPYPLREDLDWLELQDEAEIFALSVQEDLCSDTDLLTPGVSTKSSPSFLIPDFPSALRLSKDGVIPALKNPPFCRLRRRSLPHSKSLGALETLANDFIAVTGPSLSSSRPSAKPVLLSALSSAIARRERSRKIRFEALPFATHLDDKVSQESSRYHDPIHSYSSYTGRALDPELMFNSAS